MSNYVKNLRTKIGHNPILMPCVAAVIYKDGKVLLQRRRDSGKWALHGGSVELGESILEALERELTEEINIKPLNPKLMGIYSGKHMHHVYNNNDEVYVIVHIFFVEEYEAIDKESDGEVSETKWFDIKKLPDNIHEPDIPPLSNVVKYIEDKKVIIE